MVKSEPSWLEAFPKEHRRFLRKFGVPPDQNPRAPDFNRRLLALAEQGLRGMDLAIEADKLHDEVFGGALTRAANAAHFAELIEVNGAGEIEQRGQARDYVGGDLRGRRGRRRGGCGGGRRCRPRGGFGGGGMDVAEHEHSHRHEGDEKHGK